MFHVGGGRPAAKSHYQINKAVKLFCAYRKLKMFHVEQKDSTPKISNEVFGVYLLFYVEQF